MDREKDAEERGHAKGLEEGIEIGAERQMIQTIFDMNENNVEIETIAKCARKSIEEIKRILAGGRPKQA